MWQNQRHRSSARRREIPRAEKIPRARRSPRRAVHLDRSGRRRRCRRRTGHHQSHERRTLHAGQDSIPARQFHGALRAHDDSRVSVQYDRRHVTRRAGDSAPGRIGSAGADRHQRERRRNCPRFFTWVASSARSALPSAGTPSSHSAVSGRGQDSGTCRATPATSSRARRRSPSSRPSTCRSTWSLSRPSFTRTTSTGKDAVLRKAADADQARGQRDIQVRHGEVHLGSHLRARPDRSPSRPTQTSSCLGCELQPINPRWFDA